MLRDSVSGATLPDKHFKPNGLLPDGPLRSCSSGGVRRNCYNLHGPSESRDGHYKWEQTDVETGNLVFDELLWKRRWVHTHGDNPECVWIPIYILYCYVYALFLHHHSADVSSEYANSWYIRRQVQAARALFLSYRSRARVLGRAHETSRGKGALPPMVTPYGCRHQPDDESRRGWRHCVVCWSKALQLESGYVWLSSCRGLCLHGVVRLRAATPV